MNTINVHVTKPQRELLIRLVDRRIMQLLDMVVELHIDELSELRLIKTELEQAGS